jgi:serine/threonine protein kinase
MLNPNEVIAGRYRIVRHLNRGMMANAYEAERIPDRRRVFFKEYISPRPSVVWYGGFVEHQKELTRSLRNSSASQFCLLPEDTFEADSRQTAAGEKRKTPPTLYQSFEFIDGGLDLEKRLEGDLSWDDRRMFASVLAFSLRELHAAGVVHADLKPANLQIVEKAGPAGRMIRTPRLIDMDFSVLVRKRPPWHGHNGYVGTAGYMSPEHLGGPDSIPLTASDVFTAGVILHELLGGKSPLAGLEDTEYLDRVRSGKVATVALVGTFGRSEHDAQVVQIISRCLSFDPRRRPTAAELHMAITGAGGPPPVPPRPVPPPAPPPAASRPAAGSGSASTTATGASAVSPASGLRLYSESVTIDVRVTTVIGRVLLGKLGPDSRFAAPEQYRIARVEGGWCVEHLAVGGNQTLVNGREVVGQLRIAPGDRIAVGNASKSIEKLTLRVESLA